MGHTRGWTTDVDPQTKAMQYGIQSLTDAELLALVIRNGTKEKNALDLAREVLGDSEGFFGLMESDKADLRAIAGIGEARAYLLLAVQQIAIRAYSARKVFRLPISSSKEAADIVMQELRYERREYVVLMMLDVRLRIMDRQTVFIGTSENAMFSTREVYSLALRKKAHSVILFHNHPSGDPSPSDADIKVTKVMEEAGQILEIPLLDHIIIGDFRYFSFSEHEMLGTSW